MAKGTAQIQSEADIARKKAVDAKNAKAAAKGKAEIEELANTPLTAVELAFCLDIEPKMNKGRKSEMPCSADILRYAKLRGRMDVKAKVEGDDQCLTQ